MQDEIADAANQGEGNAPVRRCVGFKEVEVIEFPMVAGGNHPSLRHIPRFSGANEDMDHDSGGNNIFDSADIALDWEAQARTKMDVDTYEEKQKKLRMGKKLKRMSRAVRKRILRNIGVETSDIESEDERRSKKAVKKKKKKRKSTKKTKRKKDRNNNGSKMSFRMNPFSSTSDTPASPMPAHPQDRFSCDEYRMDRLDHAPKLPQRKDRGLGLPPRRSSIDNISEVENALGDSPPSTKKTMPSGLESLQSQRDRNLTFLSSNPSTSQDNSFLASFDDSGTPPSSPSSSRRLGRRTSLDHVTSAIGVLAKQPVRLAKQPVRFAKYTSKKVRKGVSRVRRPNGESSDDEVGLGGSDLESFPPSSGAGNLSSDDEYFLGLVGEFNGTDSFSTNPGAPVVPARVISDSEEHHPSWDYPCSNMKTDCIPLSPPVDSRRRRRSSLSHVTNAIGVLAKQPVRLAKQPVRFAKYTSKKMRKRAINARNPKSDDDDYDEDSLEEGHATFSAPLPTLPTWPPLYVEESGDDDGPLVIESELNVTRKHDRGDTESADDDIDDSDCDDIVPTGQAVPRRRRRSSLQHVTSAIGTVAKQPYRFAKYTAKQPVKFAKYTGKKIRKRMRKRNEDSDIVTDSDDAIVSEDDTNLDVGLIDPSASPVQPYRVVPERLLPTIIDDYNSSEDLSAALNGDDSRPDVRNNSLDLSDVMIDDLEDASEDEDIVEAEMHDIASSTRCDGDTHWTQGKQNPRRMSMTGEIHQSDEISLDDDILDDLMAGVDQEDMDFLGKESKLDVQLSYCHDRAEKTVGLSPVATVKLVVSPALKSANPQDTADQSDSAIQDQLVPMGADDLSKKPLVRGTNSFQSLEEHIRSE